MSNNSPSWIRRISDSWDFYYENFRLSLFLGLISLVFLSFGIYLLAPLKREILGEVLMAASVGLALASLFNILYEARTRESFRKMLADINPNIQSGVIVHPTHDEVISRKDALQRYLLPRQEVRIITSTADNYVRKGEPAYDTLLGKVRFEKCRVKILLYFPVIEQREGIRVGQERREPQQLMFEHRALMGDYEELIKEGKGAIEIKFFTIPHHTNFIMIGNERMYSAPIMHSVGGRRLPCYEIYPTGDNSLFYKFQTDFDFIFQEKRKGVVLTLEEGKAIYDSASYQYDKVRKEFKRKFMESTHNQTRPLN